MDYLTVKWLHIISATFLAGTGFGTAFYMFWANRSKDVRAIAVVTRFVALADWLFTAPAVVVQPVTGLYLAHLAGWEFGSGWLHATLWLYALAGACWLPVVWLQLRMRDMAKAAAQAGTALPALYWRYERWWVLLGIPAFTAVGVIYWLMVVKP
jgi:uncharacterized membrane protein